MNDFNQPLRDLFESINAEKLAEMQERREEESSTLEFKRMDRTGNPSKEDEATLRRAVSGFANSAGGIVLWGVESKDPVNRNDRSRFQALAPVADGVRAQIRFHELTATATQPAVSGVIHRAIAVEGGFVIKTFVPASDGGPYRTNEDKGQYYRRDADAFRAMQHHEIADMFGRRARPSLELDWQADLDPRLPTQQGGVWLLQIRNVGRGLARFPCLVLTEDPRAERLRHYGLDGRQSTGIPLRQGSPGIPRTFVFAARADDVVHPGQTIQITRIGLSKESSLVRVRFELYAEGMPFVEGRFRMWPGSIRMDTPQELLD